MKPRRAPLARLLGALATLTALARPAPAEAASDPSLKWSTIETPHFRITYHSGIETQAQHVANVCEGIHEKMTKVMGHTPKPKTEVVISDFSESANGSATALPYNALRLLVTAPEDLSPLGDVDDWLYALITHEYTHVLHTDNIHGLPTLVNTVLGKTFAPNQVQPRFILEGVAVHEESKRTSGGRLRNSMWKMFMRTDVLEDNVAPLDQIVSNVRRWPQGNLFYLYGSWFIDWIAETYGEDTIPKISEYYGGQIIPWGINRAMRRATGKTYEELYVEWVGYMRAKYAAEERAIRKKGLREGTRLTFHGQVARYPRWIPKGAWADHQGGLMYYREDAHGRPGLYAVDLKRTADGRVAKTLGTELVARTPSETYASFLPDGGLVFGSLEFHKNVFAYGVLERMAPGEKSVYGTPDGHRERITETGARTDAPTTSPDGRRIVYTVNRGGTRTLHIADLTPEGVVNARPLVPTATLEQAFSPRFSPDGKQIAYGSWVRGGFRDIRIVDLTTGAVREVTRDRAVDGNPSFSADGRLLFFHSDRTGVSNLYAYELETSRTRQITNVRTGAYSPEPSPDGKTLAYIGYTHKGFDLFAIPLDESTWTEAEPHVDDRPEPAPITSAPIPEPWKTRAYNPLETLWPRRYGIQVTPGNFGQAIILSASASDIVGLHTITATTTTEVDKPELQGALSYVYSRLPFDMGLSAFRTITPRGGYQIGPYQPPVVQETAGLASTIVLGKPRTYDASSYTITHSLARVGAEYPMPADKLDPQETPSIPPRGLTSTLHLGYAFTNAERYLWSVGPERGYQLSLAFDLTDPLLGSQYRGFAANGDFTVYYLMPWLRHHSLALHGGAGTSGGQFPGRGGFFVGGFVDLPVIDTLRNILIQGGIVLRGYQPVALAGRSYVLGNAEYRFPIVNLDRGSSTLPFMLNRINGSAFVDYGSAFDDFTSARFKTGVGGELWFDFTLGYVASFTFRAGYARGLASGGIDKVYWVAAFPY